MNDPRNGLGGFYQLLEEVAKISSWVLPAAGVSPVIASLIGINPPWPSKVGLTVATSVVVLFTLVMTYHFLYLRRRRLTNLVMAIAVALIVLSAFLYFFAFAALTYQTPVTQEIFAKGFVCTSDAITLFGEKCPWLDLDELKGAEYEASRLWTAPSIAVVRVFLLFAWFSMFCAGAALVGAFVNFQAPLIGKNIAK